MEENCIYSDMQLTSHKLENLLKLILEKNPRKPGHEYFLLQPLYLFVIYFEPGYFSRYIVWATVWTTNKSSFDP